ncbi:PREDICTED: beta-1,3-galactosyltransferase brn-like [Priapulus caudatus]|uniref:Hexosyltransferase n=1 Tax=Priapulus caudatus TaxID=37621 RepID=A0ABM1DVI2_PRICU|nr:PREDICTED: beta-1,3-galactosyltransferase brn-like [Priapulus caudatus]
MPSPKSRRLNQRTDQLPMLPRQAMSNAARRRILFILLAGALCLLMLYFGVFTHLYEVDYAQFHYPLDVDLRSVVAEMREHHRWKQRPPINPHDYRVRISNSDACRNNSLRLLILVKSALDNAERRAAIRRTWGAPREGAAGATRAVFLLGERPGDDALQRRIAAESAAHGDVVQEEFVDAYYNNTLKTVAGLRWVAEHCARTRYIMFADDDMYVSPRNALRRLAAHDDGDGGTLFVGYRFFSAPMRHHSSRWYVSLDEYAFSMYPPYLTAGAFLLSRATAVDMYHGALYTKHFRFDDIFLGIVAKKLGVEPTHDANIYFYKKRYSRDGYRDVIASHGYDDPDELLAVWRDQNAAA